ncbi:tRNA wybutosine-synthesizing protein 2 [Bulinus truncatus]|nr:tRNA wybutosine-synthesizing protein 2 [Bulinus truncatus]
MDKLGKTKTIIAAYSDAQKIRQQLEELHLWNGDYQLKQLPNSQVAIPVTVEGDNLDELRRMWPDHSVVEMNLPLSKKSKAKKLPPAFQMKEKIQQLLKDHSPPEDLLKEVPEKWEKHGDLVLLPSSSFRSSYWKNIDNLWEVITKCLKCKRLARHSSIARDGFRSSQVVMLFGDDGIVMHTDNGIKYTYDVTKCMFSIGNITEKLRISKFDCRGETVVDLYAGIGYFTLPYLVHAKADFVHACEWNPDAAAALKDNLVINGVSHRCSVHFGDNRQLKLTSVADRVNLGLIPSSEEGWPIAVQVLKNSGGTLHVHGNVTTNKKLHKPSECSISCELSQTCLEVHDESCTLVPSETPMGIVTNNHSTSCTSDHSSTSNRNESENFIMIGNPPSGKINSNGDKNSLVWSSCKKWSKFMQSKISQLLEEEKGGHWSVKEIHIELVKWYAPHVMHVVVDLDCRPCVTEPHHQDHA